ncbi:MAG: tRNA (adenosine(37)-N6)-threonylcarbamoyltransferase complex ATPase subunit type 1 TsaE [Patescibacteria group bacterium]|nr:tRNA (adenosine(37)-N6)-threonylcarbamoyltransferase complex ATPase subunit type 1 TsaE [Patescibacteria group bacterium]
METIKTLTADETQAFGKAFAAHVADGGTILLHGDLGAGKTTFVQGLAKGLGVAKRIISPTFVILRTYTRGNANFYHIDLYRLNGSKHELEEIGLLDLLKNPEHVTAIEWPEKMEAFKPQKRWEIYFKPLDENKREIIIHKYE